MAQKIKAMTFNLRIAVKGDGINYFDYRLPRIIEFLDTEKPDVIGFQEVDGHMKELLVSSVSGYTFVGCGRNSDYTGESAVLAFRTGKFELLELENFWLSATPKTPGSRYGFDQSSCPRVTTAALLKMEGADTPFWFVNTHLDHEGKMARMFGAMQIMQFMSTKKEPCILTGDLNAGPDSPAIKLISENKNYPMTDCTANVGNTFHAYRETPYAKIDYIFTNLACNIDESLVYPDVPVEGVYMSDHRPVGAFIEIE